MDLSFGPAYENFRTEVREFIREHGHEAPPRVDLRAPRTLAWQQRLIEHGYAGRTIAREYGGYGAQADVLEARIIAEEFAAAQVSPGLAGQGIKMLIPTLLHFGSEQQRRDFIRPTLYGEMIWCQGYSEPNAGSDLASLRTHAVLDGDHWRVNGQKIWTSTAHLADWMFCLVRTEPDAPKHQGISFLLFPMSTPGIEIRPLVTMVGDASFNEVFFTDVRVPRDSMIGQRGDGWKVANTLLGFERGMLGDPNNTLMRFNALVELMQHETVDGTRLIDQPLLRERLMKIQGRMLALRANDLRLLSASVNDTPARLAGLVVKLLGTDLRHELEALAIDALGEIGALYRGSPLLRDEGMWQQHYMYFLGLIIGGGTAQIQKNIIAERGLGMPREPKLA
ncbi:MAG: acyl-CoA dehydrogenase family protein [Gammaproteobacteria bacterium]|nr:acyl-CoA dehydrogenase family protein [Gammaproteobacteria bacterium]